MSQIKLQTDAPSIFLKHQQASPMMLPYRSSKLNGAFRKADQLQICGKTIAILRAQYARYTNLHLATPVNRPKSFAL
jgi:hypothetical protein